MAVTRMTERFLLQAEHLELLGQSYFGWDDWAYEGAVRQDIKRPYGNSDVFGDIYEILHGAPWDEGLHGEMSDEVVEELRSLHQDMGLVVQILALSAAHGFPFETDRIYRKTEIFDDLSWRPEETA